MSIQTPLAAGIMFALSVSAAAAAEPIRAGWVEKAVLFAHRVVLHAKLDTGAQTSSLNAADHEIFKRDGDDWVRVSITDRGSETVTIEAPVVRHSKIKRHFGERQLRPVILLDLCVGNVRKKTEVNLIDRTGMNYQLLVGRNFLKDTLLVDSGATYALSTDCPG